MATIIRNLRVPQLIPSKSPDKDLIRKEFILRVLLGGSVALSSIAFVSLLIVTLIYRLRGASFTSVPLGYFSLVPILFISLLILANTGLQKIVAYFLIFLYFIFATYTAVFWGADVPQSLLIDSLVIVMAGILISTRFTFFMTAVISITLIGTTYLQTKHIILIDSLWRNQAFHIGDATVYAATLTIIAFVSWLSNREIEKALKRAQESEKALQKEKDSLEIKVEERTRELQKMQLEKVMQVYQFADLGKLAAGLLHDLTTPLNVVSLNLENLQEETTHTKRENAKVIKRTIKRALESTKGIEKFVIDTRRQLHGQQTKSYFNLAPEVDSVLDGLANKSSEARVKLIFNNRTVIHTLGNPFRFHQMAINLISNAIDAYTHVTRKSNRIVYIRLFRQNNFVIFEVEDLGTGISRRNLTHIFEPFFTTKTIEKGTGIGLSICKDIIEKDFGGSITVKSHLHKGSIFRAQFPIISKKKTLPKKA